MRKAIVILSLALMTTNSGAVYYPEIIESSSKLEKIGLLFFITATFAGIVGMAISLYSGAGYHCPSDETSWCCLGFTRCYEMAPSNDSCQNGDILLCGPDGNRHVAPYVKKPWYEPTMISFGMIFAVGAIFSASIATWIYYGHNDQALKPMNQPLVNAVS